MRLRFSIIALLLTFLLSGCAWVGQGQQTNNTNNGPPASPPTAVAKDNTKKLDPPWPKIHVKAIGQLPEAVIGNALAINRQGLLYSVGGYTGKQSISKAYRLENGTLERVRLPQRVHDAAAGFVGENLFIFGGGQSESYDTIVSIRSRKSSIEGRLVAPLSDAAAIPFRYKGKEGVAVIGGYDGKAFNHKVRFYTTNQTGELQSNELFTLPVGLRYVSVASDALHIFIAGGKSSKGESSDVYEWSEKSSTLQAIGKLPYGVEKAAAFISDKYLIIAGGISQDGSPKSDVVAFNITSGESRSIASLPTPLADMGYAQGYSVGYLAGGIKSIGANGISSLIYQVNF